MSIIHRPFRAGQLDIGTASIPERVAIAGTNFPAIGYAFQKTGTQYIYLITTAALYGTGNPNLLLNFYSRSGSTTGNVVWTASMACITPGDATSYEAKSYATAQSAGAVTINGTAKGMSAATISITNLDSISADDEVVIRISRGASDTMVGDAILTGGDWNYST